MRLSILFFLLVATFASCHYASPDLVYVPDHPGYDEDVHPLFSDHCLLCHSHPANRGAPNTGSKAFRLDVYDDTDGIPGAFASGRNAVYDVEIKRMPPAAKDGEGVGPNGLLMLQHWVNDGMPRNRP
jgi:hypothetical protein